MQKEFLFSGFGGQGVMFAGQLLAYAAMDEGLEVTWIPSYGPEMRGGTAHCFVVISDKPIGSPVTRHPQVAVVFNNPSFTKYEGEVAPGGLLAVNSSLINQESRRTDISVLPVPATQLADSLGDLRMANVVMLGAVLEVFPALPPAAIHRALEAHLPERRRHLLEANYKALEKGAEFARSMVKSA
ncbi:MAG: 2-oxoacid:ferredoxin oxidoreductase subunit gamma [Chloroflexi bacterium]|nr:2-oxoacid:ferredoxin oxidoreductase subunit gamma [Chloroflexota bacterium]MDL1883242.1 2-oxoacid:ferredoxin oxidoreductase subunit gamma [Anaerolineae bacterium CFX8]